MKNTILTPYEVAFYVWNLKSEHYLTSKIVMTVCSTILSFFSEYKVSVSEIECRLQEEPEYNNSYFVKLLRERGIKIETPSIDLLANGTSLTSMPSTSTEDLSLYFNQASTSGDIPSNMDRRSPSLAEEISYNDPKESNMESTSRLKESVQGLEIQAQNSDEKRKVNENESAEQPIQRQNIYATCTVEANVEIPDYIQLPIKVNNYDELESNELFPKIKSQFLSYINELKQLVKYFVQDRYDNKIDSFYETVRVTDEAFKLDFFLLYKETRLHIRCLLTKLQRYQSDESMDVNLKDYIASVLHECLEAIDLCPAGVYDRLKHTHINLSASEEGMKGKLFSLRENLFDQSIKFFIVECQRGGLKIHRDMDVHWVSAFYNLFCDSINLPPTKDRFAIQNMSENITSDFISLAQLSVSRSSIIRSLLNDWSDEFSEILKAEGASSWETEDINLSGSGSEIIAVLDNKLLKPISSYLGVKLKDSLNIDCLVDDKGNGTYSLVRYQEKLFSFIVSHLNMSKDKQQSESKVMVLTALPKSTFPHLYLGTIENVFFWVFESKTPFEKGEVCTYKKNNDITLQLAHLRSINFSRQSDEFIYALLTQALKQTNKVEDIVSFFLHQEISKQLAKTTRWLIKKLSIQLSDKLLHCDKCFKTELCECICSTVARSKKISVSRETLAWLIDTPLLEPVLLNLAKIKIDITPIMHALTLWEINYFSAESLKTLLTPEECRRLFHQAWLLNRKEITLNLLLTEHCDNLMHSLVNYGESPLPFFSDQDNLPAVRYLLRRGIIDINKNDTKNTTFLIDAARKGRVEWLKVGLEYGARINDSSRSTCSEMTALHYAAKFGHVGCVEALCNQVKDILLTNTDYEGRTSFHFASMEGHVECLQILLNTENIQATVKGHGGGLMSQEFTSVEGQAAFSNALCLLGLNKKDDKGLAPLHYAAIKGHLMGLKALLNEKNLLIHVTNKDKDTALHLAAKNGSSECIKELLKRGIPVNVKNRFDNTPLMSATYSKDAESLRVLLNAGAAVNEPNLMGTTPLLRTAADKDMIECFEVLFNTTGILINQADDYAQTPLHRAAWVGNLICLQRLVTQKGIIHLNDMDKEGCTPLHLAAEKGHGECVKALCIVGADVNMVNNKGNTPLDCAKQVYQTDSIKEVVFILRQAEICHTTL